MMREKWLIFDAMGVIFEVGDDTQHLLIPYIQQRTETVSAAAIHNEYLSVSLGHISSAEFWENLGFAPDYPEIELDYLETCLTLDPEFVTVAEQLAETYSLALLSNDVKEWATYLRAKFDLNRLFNTIVISGEVGCRKPDPEIYHILLDRIQTLPEDCMFIDDRGKNLRPAAEIGMKTGRFLREEIPADFTTDFEIRSFGELPAIIEQLF